MSQNILSGTAAVFLLATTAIPMVGAAESVEEGPQIRSASSIARTLGSPSQPSRLDLSSTSTPSSSSLNSVSLKSPGPSSPNPSNPGPSRPEPFSPIPSGPSLPKTVAQGEVVKIGEQSPASGTSVSSGQSSSSSHPATVIAKVHSHEVDGRKAATLYVRNIPVLTFLGAPIQDSTSPSLEAVKLGERSESLPVQNGFSSTKSLSSTGSPGVTFFSESKSSATQPAPDQDASEQRASEQRASNQSASNKSVSGSNEVQQAEPSLGLSAAAGSTAIDPVARASEMAAMLNTLNRDGMDATQITVSAEETKALLPNDRFVIKMGETRLATLDAETTLPDSTQNRQQDALQATNRLRRLLGNAEPLPYVVYNGKPLGSLETGAIASSVQGWASWYGPGFHGNLTANGEVFNQNDLTAAHQTLPFGTRVRVTNMDNGISVLVRITDRGPFVGDRILDLSMGAARVLGLIQSGVAPVRLDILEKPVTLVSR